MKDAISFEETLLLIYTKRHVLEEYCNDPEKFLSALNLTDQERRAILGIPKEALWDFHKQLNLKKMRMAKKILTEPNIVVVSPFHPSGEPVIMWGPKPHTVSLTLGMFLLFDSLGSTRTTLSVMSILHAYEKIVGDERVGLKDLFRVVTLLYTQRLTDMKIVSI